MIDSFLYHCLSHCFWPTKAPSWRIRACSISSDAKIDRAEDNVLTLYTIHSACNLRIIFLPFLKNRSFKIPGSTNRSCCFSSWKTTLGCGEKNLVLISFILFILFYHPQLFQVRTCVPCVQVNTPLIHLKHSLFLDTRPFDLLHLSKMQALKLCFLFRGPTRLQEEPTLQ